MVAKKKAKLSHRQRFIKFILVPGVVLAVLLFGAIQMMRVSQLETALQHVEMQSFLTRINSSYSPFVIDGGQKLAYVPELSLVIPYDGQLSNNVRYMVDLQDTASSSGVVTISTLDELQKTGWNNDGPVWDGCRSPFNLVVGSTEFEDKDVILLNKTTLRDGRTLSIYKSTLKECGAFTSSADGGTLTDMLQRTQSY